jgi:hypothetical protein
MLFGSVASDKDLQIHGVKDEIYASGETVNLTCVSDSSKPPTVLAWFVDQQQVRIKRLTEL